MVIDYGRPVDLGRPEAETVNVTVETNVDVVASLGKVVNSLVEVIEEIRKTQLALSLISGEELDLD